MEFLRLLHHRYERPDDFASDRTLDVEDVVECAVIGLAQRL